MDGNISFFFTAPELIACGAFAAVLIWLVVDITVKDVRLLTAILRGGDEMRPRADGALVNRFEKPLPVFAAAQRMMILAANGEPRRRG